MKARVLVFYKDSVFDPQGNTLGESLKRIGFDGVRNVRVGKAIHMEVEAGSAGDAKARLAEMCEKLLVNPVIESYAIEIEETPKR